MDPYTISCLSSNLSLLVKEEATHNLNNSSIVPSLDALVLHDGSSFMGRSWSLLYSISETLFGGDYKKKKYTDAVKAISESLKSCFTYVKSLNEKTKEARKEKSVSKVIRQEIIDVGEALSIFFSYNSSFLFQKKISLIQSCFNRVVGNQIISKDDTVTLEKFGKNYAVGVMEGILQRPFPTPVFLKLLKEETLDYQEAYDIDKWIEAINMQGEHLPPWLLHLSLEQVVECEINPDKIFETVCLLEELLLKRGLELVEKEDPQITKWSQHFVMGDCLDIDKEDVLGSPILHPLFPAISIIAFENLKNPNEMIVIGKSFITLGMWLKNSQECWAVPPVKVTKAGKSGRYFVMEKLKGSLNERTLSKRFGSIAEEDKEPLDEIAKFVNWLSMQEHTPLELESTRLFFNMNNKLRTLIPLKKSDFNYSVLENFCIDSANGNYFALRHIMQRSELYKHPIGQYYLDVIRDSLLEKASFIPGDEAIIRKIVDATVVDRANKLIKKEKELSYSLFVKLHPKLKKKGEEAKNRLNKEIIQAILAFHSDVKIPASCFHEADKRITDYIMSRTPDIFVNKPTQEFKQFSSFLAT